MQQSRHALAVEFDERLQPFCHPVHGRRHPSSFLVAIELTRPAKGPWSEQLARRCVRAPASPAPPNAPDDILRQQHQMQWVRRTAFELRHQVLIERSSCI